MSTKTPAPAKAGTRALSAALAARSRATEMSRSSWTSRGRVLGYPPRVSNDVSYRGRYWLLICAAETGHVLREDGSRGSMDEPLWPKPKLKFETYWRQRSWEEPYEPPGDP